MPESFSGFRLTNPTVQAVPFLYTSGGLRAFGEIHPRRCNLIVLTGVNASDKDCVLQLHESVPRQNNVPVWVVAVPARGQFSWVPAQGGRVFRKLHFGVSKVTERYVPVAPGIGFWVDAEGLSLD